MRSPTRSLVLSIVYALVVGACCGATTREIDRPVVIEAGCKLDPVRDAPPKPPADDTFTECDGWAACLTEAALEAEDAYDEARSRWESRVWTLCGPATPSPQPLPP